MARLSFCLEMVEFYGKCMESFLQARIRGSGGHKRNYTTIVVLCLFLNHHLAINSTAFRVILFHTKLCV